MSWAEISQHIAKLYPNFIHYWTVCYLETLQYYPYLNTLPNFTLAYSLPNYILS